MLDESAISSTKLHRAGAKRLRVPIWFAIAGAAVKALTIVGWRVSGSTTVFRFLTDDDPIAFRFAELGVGLVFDERRIAPGHAESLTFDGLLVLGFSLQAFLVGILVQSARRRL